jgi:hypothetical protein
MAWAYVSATARAAAREHVHYAICSATSRARMSQAEEAAECCCTRGPAIPAVQLWLRKSSPAAAACCMPAAASRSYRRSVRRTRKAPAEVHGSGAGCLWQQPPQPLTPPAQQRMHGLVHAEKQFHNLVHARQQHILNSVCADSQCSR